MKARTMGRALGIGTRLLASAASRWMAGDQPPAALRPNAQPEAIAGDRMRSQPPGVRTGSPARPALRRGLGGFLRPFGRVGRILWLEVTGTLFLLPAVVFTPALLRDLRAYPHTTDHRPLWVAAAVVAVFLYLGISSFWRAHRRSMRE